MLCMHASIFVINDLNQKKFFVALSTFCDIFSTYNILLSFLAGTKVGKLNLFQRFMLLCNTL